METEQIYDEKATHPKEDTKDDKQNLCVRNTQLPLYGVE